MAKDEKDLLLSTADNVGDLLSLRWENALNAVAIEMHGKYPDVSESMWLYYYYCGFLRQTLTEFDRVLQESDSLRTYYEHYRERIGLFNEMATALERERPFLDAQADVTEAVIKAVGAEIDIHSSRLGAEWRQAVQSAARDLRLTNFSKKVV
jgi:hypothetical protein